MLDAYWLFGEPNTDTALNPNRLDEYISLFKHACLFQRKVNLTDLMVIGAPNFWAAYRQDEEFKKLVDSDIVQISYMHGEDDGRGAPMDLMRVTNFHIENDLIHDQAKRFFWQGGGERLLKEVEAKHVSTLIVRDASRRDPQFTTRVMNALTSPYLVRHLGNDRALFEACTREVHAEFAALSSPLGLIWFDDTRPHRSDGSHKWRFPTALDRMFDRMRHLTPERRQEICNIVWRFCRAHIFRSEADLMAVDPVIPPETAFYVDVMYGRPAETVFTDQADDKLHIYRIATDLDDETLYRYLDFKTILEVRKRGMAYFDAAAPVEAPPGMGPEDLIYRDKARAAQLGAALKEYKHAAVSLLSERFPLLCQTQWEREILLRVATVIERAAVDAKGRPRPLVSALVTSTINKVGSKIPFELLLGVPPEARIQARYLMSCVTPMLYIAEGRVAAAVENLANRQRLQALLGDAQRTPMDARLIAEKAFNLTDSTTIYGPLPSATDSPS